MNLRYDRVIKSYNLDLINFDCLHEGGMPVIEPVYNVEISNMVAFTDRSNCNKSQTAVHFFLDDFRFSGTWKDPRRYVPTLKQFACTLTPDFSCYVDMLEPQARFNVYRGRAIGQIWQKQGLTVIPTLTWGMPDTYDWCFQGLLEGGAVAISTVGLMESDDGKRLFIEGANEAMRRLEPSQVFAYGKPCEFDANGAEVQWFDNKQIAKLKKIDCEKRKEV